MAGSCPVPCTEGLHQAGMGHPGWVTRGSECPSVPFGQPSRSPAGSGEQNPGLMPDIRKRIFYPLTETEKFLPWGQTCLSSPTFLSGSRLGKWA